jgi:hypothetical protein
MGEMTARERRILVRCYGLDDREPASLAELSAELGVTRERVRQLQRNAERRLRERLVSECCHRDRPLGKEAATNRGNSNENSIKQVVQSSPHHLPVLRIR